MKALLLLLCLVFTGCAAAGHFFDEGVDHPVYSPWAKAEAARLAPIYDTNPDLSTRFLRLPPQGTWEGWNDGFRITICLLDPDGVEWPAWRIHNIWHHEWMHHWKGGIRFDAAHLVEYRLELTSMGMWEYP